MEFRGDFFRQSGSQYWSGLHGSVSRIARPCVFCRRIEDANQCVLADAAPRRFALEYGTADAHVRRENEYESNDIDDRAGGSRYGV